MKKSRAGIVRRAVSLGAVGCLMLTLAAPAGAAPEWLIHEDLLAGVALEYQADWTAESLADADGNASTTFTAPGGAASLTLVAHEGLDVPPGYTADLPNGQCEDVVANGLRGWRCFDTLSPGMVAVLAGDTKTYTLDGVGKRSAAGVFEHMLSSLRPLGWPVRDPRPVELSTTLPPARYPATRLPGDLPFSPQVLPAGQERKSGPFLERVVRD